MYIFINDISKTAFGDFHASLWSTNPESFMRFANTRCKRGTDPMEITYSKFCKGAVGTFL